MAGRYEGREVDVGQESAIVADHAEGQENVPEVNIDWQKSAAAWSPLLFDMLKALNQDKEPDCFCVQLGELSKEEKRKLQAKLDEKKKKKKKKEKNGGDSEAKQDQDKKELSTEVEQAKKIKLVHFRTEGKEHKLSLGQAMQKWHGKHGLYLISAKYEEKGPIVMYVGISSAKNGIQSRFAGNDTISSNHKFFGKFLELLDKGEKGGQKQDLKHWTLEIRPVEVKRGWDALYETFLLDHFNFFGNKALNTKVGELLFNATFVYKCLKQQEELKEEKKNKMKEVRGKLTFQIFLQITNSFASDSRGSEDRRQF